METQKLMSELAFNLNGDPFEIPPGAVASRVRPREADVDDLRAEVTSSGRYRVDAIDENQRPIEGAQAGYVYVHELSRPVEPAAPVVQANNLAPLPSPSDSVVIEAMRMNAEIARAVGCKLPQMFEAGAQLLRAADGAGLPARPPMAVTEDDEGDGGEDELDAAPAASPLSEVIGQLM